MDYRFYRLVERRYELTEEDRKLLNQLHWLKNKSQQVMLLIIAGLFILCIYAALKSGL